MNTRNLTTILTAFLLLTALSAICDTTMAQQFTDQVKKPVDESITIRQQAQKDEEKWDEEKSALESEFENLRQAEKGLSEEVRKLSEQVAAKKQRVSALNEQLRSMEKISEELVPFLEKVYAQLEALLQAPPLFLVDERTARLESLRQTLDDSQVALGEKFRKVMEALFIEAEYGNTVETRQEKIRIGQEEVLATVFRLGAMALFYETLDQQGAGYFDLSQNQWSPLEAGACRDIRVAVEIASKTRPAEIVSLPLGRIVVK